MLEPIPNTQQWERGPKITAIGGGTGLSTMLRGLKKYTRNLTAVVTVADDGGGSGVLRRDMGMPPPGDIRHCMEALANVEPIMQRLLTYRFTEGALTGQSFGNLILAALNGVTGSFEEAVSQMSQVLAITGRVIPVTSADVQLEASLKTASGCGRVQDLRREKAAGLPYPPCGADSRQAPGPARRFGGHSGGGPAAAGAGEPVHQRDSQPAGGGGARGHPGVGRPEDLCVQHHDPGRRDRGLYRRRPRGGPADPRGPGGPVSGHSAPVGAGLLERYRAEDAAPLVVDRERIAALGLELEERPVASEDGNFARHDPDKLASAVLELYRRRAVRIFRGKNRYIIEE